MRSHRLLLLLVLTPIAAPACVAGRPAARAALPVEALIGTYDLVSLGDIGPNVPGYALIEIDPARVRLLPVPRSALPYPPGLDDTDS